ncbi:phosphatidate cytidylyltransferase [Desulfonema ishimotonii]|uniref:Phosphatidate cytidylyltransferase n=1 Tax=Desulfonema ishimotonii TaxID=45657 RepID=A0A401FQR3_9BACT|nr:phosphatidate cytidylyltransferase [Desulfonema ishimotonii]GBC59300.1 phosphatidate cytidylyltransferase [Desulfonema ishimotonii]
MHLKRWITGLTALPFLIYLIVTGGTAFAVFIGIVCLLALTEYFRIVFSSRPHPLLGVMPVLAMLTGPVVIWVTYRFTAELALCAVAFNLIACALYSLTRFKSDPAVLSDIALQVRAVVYIPVLLSFAILIRNGSDGLVWLFFLLGIVFAGDIGALYAGTYLGKHKLCPSVSPGKTVEGALGGLAANLLIGSLIRVFFLPGMAWGGSLLFFLCAGIAGQVGDLFESEFKRAAGIKDSGVILPGHGGILDRIDALLFALPVAYFFKKFILWV